MNFYCNPLNLPYKYQWKQTDGKIIASREAADPSMILFKEIYYLFPSMTAGFFTSENLIDWEFHKFNQKMPIYDYAPDIRVAGDYMYFSASKGTENSPFYRTKDPINGTFEKIAGSFPFGDPNLFVDDDGRFYFYWSCSNVQPIYGVELDTKTMKPIGEKAELIWANAKENGFERTGDDHVAPKSPEQIEKDLQAMIKRIPNIESIDQLPEASLEMLRKLVGNDPYLEGAWMTKYKGVYYLQYAESGTQYNVYGDGVYKSKNPLGPFTRAKNNPFSYKPGGFITGAGHGSTMEDKNGSWWHTSTLRISINHKFERRIGLWHAGFDKQGELFCDQSYGDWPINIHSKPWDKPEWMLLSYGKKVTVSSGNDSQNVTDEDIRTWWSADTNQPGEWAVVDLGKTYDVRAIQINFADEDLEMHLPESTEFYGESIEQRIIDETDHVTRWKLEGSINGNEYFVIEDKINADTDLPHDFLVREEGIQSRYIRLTVEELPYKQNARVSGIRVFGNCEGNAPIQVTGVTTESLSELDLMIRWNKSDALGYNIMFGYKADALYHSYMVFNKCEKKIGALIKDEPLYIRVDAFNESGITEGEVIKIV